MPLILAVTNHQGRPPAQAVSVTFDARDGTIGRTPTNDWVLPDPQQFVSGQHARIQYRDGEYYIVDTSTNGVFVNHTEHAVGRGNSVKLNHGDRLTIGDYEIRATINQPAAPLPEPEIRDPFAQIPVPGPSDTFGLPSRDAMPELPGGDLGLAPPTGVAQPGPGAPPNSHFEHLPPLDDSPGNLDALGQPAAAPRLPDDLRLPDEDPLPGEPVLPSLLDGGSEADHVPSIQEHFQPPAAIPEDWDLTGAFQTAADPIEPLAETPVVPPPQAEPPIAEPPMAEPPRPQAASTAEPPDAFEPPVTVQAPIASPPEPAATPTPARPASPQPPAPTPKPATAGASMQPAAAPSGAVSADALRAFLDGLGLTDLELDPATANQLLYTMGETLREAVRGTRDVLIARASTKSEFRMSLTTIRPIENNPLKFSMGIDDALINLITPRGQGHLPPVQSMREVFDDIKAHQLAVMAGMRAALGHLLKRFDPSALETRLQKNSMLDTMLPLNRKAKTWDLYVDFYKEIAQEAQDDFQRLFGEEFARAYEEQVANLRSADNQHNS